MPPTLNPAQQKVEDHFLLKSGFSVVLQMPTGSGKTWLAKKAIHEALVSGKRSIYLCPLKALAEELVKDWAQEFGKENVGIFTGDYGKQGGKYPVSFQKANILIMTPERLDGCTRSWRSHWSWIPEVDWLVVDEIHMLGDWHRGPRLEGTISRFKRLNPFTRILGLSATLGNRGELADWLEGVELDTDWRPVPLEWKVARYRKPEEKPSLLASEVARVNREGGQTIVFVQSRRRSEQIAKLLSEQGLNALHHHAGLTHSKRRVVESAFRNNQTSILVATSTLEMGLNLPARQVVLYDLQAFDGIGFSPLPVNTIWQRAGRAGRPGLDDSGEALLLAPVWERNIDHYSKGCFEPIRSGIARPDTLAEQILVEVHSGLARTENQLKRVFNTSLAALQKQTIDIQKNTLNMLNAGMLRKEEVGDRILLKATRLGHVVCRHQLQPSTVLRLRQFFESLKSFTDFDLLLIAASTPDCEPRLPVDYEELETLTEELVRQPSRLFEDFKHAGDLLGIGGKQLLSALKNALVLWRWMVTGDTDMVAEEEGCYPFEIHRLIESMDRLLLASASIQRAIDEPFPADQEDSSKPPKSEALLRIELLRQQILNGIEGPAAALTLVDGIGASWIRRLIAHGVCSLKSLAEADSQNLATLSKLSEKRATDWIKQASTLQQRVPATVQAGRIPTRPSDIDLEVDPYRLRRATELNVKWSQSNLWNVTGGSEPRQVTKAENGHFNCSCPDHAKGNTCKHQLAVRLRLNDKILHQSFRNMNANAEIPYLDLFGLWFERN